MIKIKHVETDRDPENDIVHPSLSGNPNEDGNLITKVLISDHGLNTDRFRKLTYEQMLYCEEILWTLVLNLRDHLTKLSDIRMNSSVYIDHLETLKK